jgi:hypothetical protein
MLPLWFEGRQEGNEALSQPPAAYLSREYLWGPGDRGVDELLCQWAWEGSIGGNGTDTGDRLWSVITDAVGDCVGLIRERAGAWH